MMDNFLMKPKINWTFKQLMTNEKARIGFLSAMLKIRPEEIKETHILNTYLRKEYAEDKQGIVDVRILLNNAVEIDCEIQLSKLKVWADRSLFYFISAKCSRSRLNQSKVITSLRNV